MNSVELGEQLLVLLGAMHEAQDKQRWRRMPVLHRRIMQVFETYRVIEPSPAALDEMKRTLHTGFRNIIQRRQQRAALLEARMASHRGNKEGMLAYSMIDLVSEHL